MNIFISPLIFLLGILLGYGVNYFADTLPVLRRFSQPLCIFCYKEISWKTFFSLKECPHCHRNNKTRRIGVLAVSIILSLVFWFFPPVRVNYWVYLLIVAYLGIMVVIDIEYRAILNQMSILGIILGFVVGTCYWGIKLALFGGLAGFLIMLTLYWLGGLFARILSRIRHEDIGEVALGFGDVTLSCILGLLLGWPLILICLLAAILLGGIISGIIILNMAIKKKYQPFTAIPYAPFLIIAAVILLYFHK